MCQSAAQCAHPRGSGPGRPPPPAQTPPAPRAVELPCLHVILTQPSVQKRPVARIPAHLPAEAAARAARCAAVAPPRLHTPREWLVGPVLTRAAQGRQPHLRNLVGSKHRPRSASPDASRSQCHPPASSANVTCLARAAARNALSAHAQRRGAHPGPPRASRYRPGQPIPPSCGCCPRRGPAQRWHPRERVTSSAALRYSVARTTRAQEHLGVLCQQRVVVLLAGPVPLLLLRDPRQANARRHAHERRGLADSLP